MGCLFQVFPGLFEGTRVLDLPRALSEIPCIVIYPFSTACVGTGYLMDPCMGLKVALDISVGQVKSQVLRQRPDIRARNKHRLIAGQTRCALRPLF